MVAIVAPAGCLSRARTASCLVPPRVEPVGLFPGFFAPRLARTSLVLLGALRCDIFGSFQLRRHHAPSPPKPRGGDEAGGAGSEEGNNLHRCRNSDALFVPKCQSFLGNVMAVFRFSRSWNDPAGCRSRSANLAMVSFLAWYDACDSNHEALVHAVRSRLRVSLIGTMPPRSFARLCVRPALRSVRQNDSTGRRQMPVSKKPRQKKSDPQSSKDAALPNRRAVEGLMSALGGRQAD